MDYFKQFPRMQAKKGNDTYDFCDLSIRFKILSEIQSNPAATYNYDWKPTDRPDIVADKYYGSADYAWVVMLSGSLYDWIYDFPMSDKMFDEWIVEQYGMSLEDTQSTIHHYEDGEGYIIDLYTYNNIPMPKYAITIYDYENERNTNRRKVQLISKSYLQKLLLEFEGKMKTIKVARQRQLSAEQVETAWR